MTHISGNGCWLIEQLFIGMSIGLGKVLHLKIQVGGPNIYLGDGPSGYEAPKWRGILDFVTV